MLIVSVTEISVGKEVGKGRAMKAKADHLELHKTVSFRKQSLLLALRMRVQRH
jgi:hypothetical protein